MTPDVMALRAHLVAEAEQAKREAEKAQRRADDPLRPEGPTWQSIADTFAEVARTATDAWLAADARLRALDGLVAGAQAQPEERTWHYRTWPPTRTT